jgi:hypothetical protein
MSSRTALNWKSDWCGLYASVPLCAKTCRSANFTFWPICMDRPRVASWIFRTAVVGLALLYPALGWSGSLLAIMDIRARSVSIQRSALEGQMGHQITNATARPVLHPLKINSQTSVGYLLLPSGALGLTEAIPSEPPSLARPDRRATMAEKGGGHPFGEPE